MNHLNMCPGFADAMSKEPLNIVKQATKLLYLMDSPAKVK
jgi:hypothetical protein